MSAVSAAGGGSAKRLAALILAVIGALFIILGIVYMTVKAGSLPSFLGSTKPANGHHRIRMIVSLTVGVVALIVAYFLSRGAKSSSGSSPTPVGAASRD